MGVKIITDSAADLPVELLQAYDIDLIPPVYMMKQKQSI